MSENVGVATWNGDFECLSWDSIVPRMKRFVWPHYQFRESGPFSHHYVRASTNCK